ncbi:MAG: glycoside hydrolase family 65 protein [Cyclobacteriaceae bacterium]|nr:glycoside hydrolase family 65 protein [Cyclobacteriaceae bacterium]
MDGWKIAYDNYVPEEEPLREAICTLGNGYFATRGAFEGSRADNIHYPGTYFAGGYNRLRSEVAGRIIENEDLVNWPDWLFIRFRIGDNPWFDLDAVEIHAYRQELDLQHGILQREILFTDPGGNKTQLTSRRIVHMDNEHIAAFQWILKPLNWSRNVVIRSGIDGSVSNTGVKRYRALNGRHFSIIDRNRLCKGGIFLKVRTRTSETVLAQASKIKIYIDGNEAVIHRNVVEMEEFIAEDLEFVAINGQDIRVEKFVTMYNSRDHAIANPLIAAEKEIERVHDFDDLLGAHQDAWKELWKRCDTVIECEGDHQRMLRLHIFHILQTTSFNTTNIDVGVPARGWHGEAYRGHIFWDELFIFPFMNFSVPEITRSLLRYRYRRLPEARYAAREKGFAGAMFPWQSGSDGREESQVVHLNPKSGRWVKDTTYMQRHVNAAIAYNVWQYFLVTLDMEFLSFFGAEIIFDIARFWTSKAVYNPEKGKYEIRHVVGPDEYHTKYPDSESDGINNNAYTNIMAVWTLMRALDILKEIDEATRKSLLVKIKMDGDEFEKWETISRNMYVPFIEGTRIIGQFEGFENLKELDWEKYRKKYGDIHRLDRILESEGDSVNEYKVSKQADVLMLFYLLSAEALLELFERLGYEFQPENILDNIEYYSKRTSHGSTLSKLVYSWVTARSHRDVSWENFLIALQSDFKDVQGGTTPEGIHLGAMAGTIDIIQRCYTGLKLHKNGLTFKPHLPDNLRRIQFRLRYQGHWLSLDLDSKQIRVSSQAGTAGIINIFIDGKKFLLKPGEEISENY